jgi:HK97 family phage portal protein
LKSLAAALANGIQKPLAVKASLQSWLGVPIRLTDGEFWREFLGTRSFTGRPVSVDQALQLSTAWACVRLISQTIATLPLGFYKRNADGSRDTANSHPLYEILHNQPNADMTAVVFWEVAIASLLLWGNAYIEIIRTGRTISALHFLNPERIVLKRLPDGSVEYRYRDKPTSGADRVISEANLMHVPAFSLDGHCGLPPVVYGVNVFGTAIETDRSSADTFTHAMRSPGLVTMDMILRKEQRDEIREHVKKVQAAGGVMVLEKGAGFQKLGFDPVSAELLASRAFNVEEICRWFGVDPALVGHGGKDSNWGTGLEQKMLWLLTLCLRTWCVRIEQAIRKHLLTPAERLTYYAEFAVEGLLRGDSAARSAFYSTMAQNGGLTRNEIRRLENLRPMPGGDQLTVQSNLVPLDQLGKAPADATARNAFLSWLGIEQPKE